NVRFDQRGYLPDPRDSNVTPAAELYVLPRNGGAPRQVTHFGVDVQDADWSPDSKSFAVIANTHQRDESTYERADLFVVTLDGQVRRLTDDGYQHNAPAWTPDGQSIIVRREQGLSMVIASKATHGAPIDLYRIPAGGAVNASSGWTNLTPKWD